MEDDVVRELRDAVAAADRELVAVVNRRLELVGRLKEHKAAVGMPFLDTRREELNLERLTTANGGPLSAEGLRRLYREVLDLTKRELGA